MEKIEFSRDPLVMAFILIQSEEFTIEELKAISDYLRAYVKNNGGYVED